MISDMILDRYLPTHYHDNVPLMRHILAATFVTPKLLSLFDWITTHFSDKKIHHLTADTRKACKKFRSKSRVKAPIENNILQLADAVYALYDDAIEIDSLEHKIKIWKIANAIACRQFQNSPPCKIQVIETIKLSPHINELSLKTAEYKLIEHANQCQAWLNGQYIDSDDDEVTDIIIKLHLLARMIRDVYNGQPL